LTDTGEQLATVKGHAFNVSRVAWAPDGRHFLTSSTNELSHSVRIWEIQSS
jgi:WD40 repeat protein